MIPTPSRIIANTRLPTPMMDRSKSGFTLPSEGVLAIVVAIFFGVSVELGIGVIDAVGVYNDIEVPVAAAVGT